VLDAPPSVAAGPQALTPTASAARSVGSRQGWLRITLMDVARLAIGSRPAFDEGRPLDGARFRALSALGCEVGVDALLGYVLSQLEHCLVSSG